MTLPEDFEDFLKLLNKYAVEYMVVGGYALAFHGKPRYTGDLDIWIDVSESNADKLVSIIQKFGFGSLGFEREDFLSNNLINQIGYPPLRIDIITSIDGVSFKEAYPQRISYEIDDYSVNYIGLNHLIENKKVSARKIDVSDVEALEKQKKSFKR